MATTSRREWLVGLGGAGLAMAAAGRAAAGWDVRSAQEGSSSRGRGTGQAAARPSWAYVGGFNDKARNERGEGISVFRVDAAGHWTLAHVLRDVVNPGFLILDEGRRHLYAVNQRIDRVSAYALDPRTGIPTLVNAESTGGLNPAHLAIDRTGRHLVVANYGAGSVAVLPIREDGGLGPATDVVAITGPLGPHRVEQSSAHPHHCPFDPTGRFVVVPDKGLDRVFVYRLDTTAGKLLPADKPFGRARAGAGPRHVDFHRSLPRAYVVNELDSTVTTYEWGAEGALEPVQIVPSIPPSFTGDNTGSEVVVSRGGRLLFASNRGHDSVGVFAIDQKGLLSPLGWEPTRGATPRFIGLSPTGSRLFAANQNGDTIVSWDVDETARRLVRTGEVVKVGCPTTIAFA